MEPNTDILVIGCGLSGTVIARELADRGKKVEIWERRDHIGGNMYDYVDDHGVLVQKYGPHTFHTTQSHLYEYMCKYEKWNHYELTCGAEIDGKFTPTPFNYKTIDDFYTCEKAAELKHKIEQNFSGQKTATVLEVLEHPDDDIRGYAQFLFEKDYSLYTAKQWGVSPSEIDPSVLRRVPLRFSYDEGYFDDPYQVMPNQSFTHFFTNLLCHPNITVTLNVDALSHLSIQDNKIYLNDTEWDKPVIYTGALDELFGGIYGNLPYRSLRFEWRHEDIAELQPYPVVAYPQAEGYTRITEYNKLPVQRVSGSSYAVEYSLPYLAGQKNEPYYPVLTEDSQAQYQRYAALAEEIGNLYCCGRLADFKYYNMDQALEKALSLLDQI